MGWLIKKKKDKKGGGGGAGKCGNPKKVVDCQKFRTYENVAI